jgi:hypothetical protein
LTGVNLVLSALEKIEAEENFKFASFDDGVTRSPFYLQKLLQIKPTKHDLIIQPVEYLLSKLEEETSMRLLSFDVHLSHHFFHFVDNLFGWKSVKKSAHELFGVQIWRNVCCVLLIETIDRICSRSSGHFEL